MESRQRISIYRNRKTGTFRIQPFGRLANGSSQAFGAEVSLPAELTNEQLLKAVLENLKKNDQQAYEKPDAPKVSEEEWHRELKEDQLIGVSRAGSRYRLVPSKRMRNSFGSIDDMILEVHESDFLSRGGEMIRRMFEEIP